MPSMQYKDNAETKLAGAINNSDDPVTFSVTAGTGTLFPSLTAGQWFPIVVVDSSGNYEKMKVTGRSTDSLTAVRAQGGTTKRAFSIGDAVYLGMTKEFLDEFLMAQDAQAGKPFWCGTAAGTANAITLSATPTLTAYGTGLLLIFKAALANTGAVTVNVDGNGAKSVVDQSGTALPSGTIRAGGHYILQYDGTNLVLLNKESAAVSAFIATLLDDADAATARATLGLPIGTSGAVVPLLNANNTHGGNNTFSGTNAFQAITTATITAAGAITSTGDITAFFSDDRLKTRLGRIRWALKKVLSLDAFYYEPNFLARSFGYSRERMIGLSAQQVRVALPEVIAPAPINGQIDQSLNPDYITIKYEKLTALLVAAIKDLFVITAAGLSILSLATLALAIKVFA